MNQRRILPKPASLDSILGRAHLSVALMAVLMAGLTLTACALFALRVYSEQNLRLVARSISYTVEAAVVFADPIAAQETLAMIGANEDIAEASVRDRRGQLLASWKNPRQGARYALEQKLASWVLPGPIQFPILHDETEIGQIRLTAHSSGLLSFLLSGLGCVAVCLITSMTVALHLSRRMQAGIIGPLRELAEVAHKVSRDRSFGLRVPPASIAELNQLNEDFNALLDELEVWQHHLQVEHATLSHRATHDSLTGLSNRAYLESELERAITDAAYDNRKVAVLFLDSDHFKEINDNYGHASGDEVLVTIANRIKNQLRDGDLVARLGGDEFAILLKPLRHSNDALLIADKILEEVSAAIELPTGDIIATSLSIGIAIFPDHAQSSATMLAAADEAMYRAKQMQRGSRQVAA